MKDNIIITGGAGFIGSHVTDLMVSKGYNVTVFDDLSTGVKSNINKQAKFVKIDITNFKKVNTLVKKIKPICIFHLAAWPRIGRSMDDPIGTNNVNVNGTLTMLESARINDVPRFVFSSSSSVYGEQKNYLMNEEMVPNPMSHYALQKLIGEKYATFYARSFGMKIITLRYFSVYGDRQPNTGPYSLVISKFIDQYKKGQKLTVFGNGNQTRDFTHVSDVANANYLSLKAILKGGVNYIVNIGASKETSVKQIAEIVGGEIEYIMPNPRAKFEELRKMANNQFAKRILKWSAKVDIIDGLKKLLNS